MDPLCENILIGLGTGLLSGYYSGLVISRTSRFHSLLRDAQRVLKQVDFEQQDTGVVVRGWEPKQLGAVADDLASDREAHAASVVRARSIDVTKAFYAAVEGKLNATEFEAVVTRARNEIAKLRPSLRVLIPWGQM
ncbi:hypothetical protein [Stenotrophomonas pavanii]|uniref:hypothetical protein n=1 Tax=Stenotrophomonas pavanii TaxID=487698 RepID=UPI0039C5D582